MDGEGKTPPSRSQIEFTEPKTDEEFAQYYQLRYERLRKPLGLPPGSEREDGIEPGSAHFMAKVDGQVVAAGCWVVGMRKDESGKREMFVRFRQSAVHPDFEARGFGPKMMRHVEDEARKIGAVELVANVRSEYVEYYEYFGWVQAGEGVQIHGVEHRSMVKPLSAPPRA